MCLRRVIIFALIGFIEARVVNLSCDDNKAFVDGHNMIRMNLALGQMPGQPAASYMNQIVFDSELFNKSANYASLNRYEHNPDTSIASGRFRVGENLYVYQTSDQNYQYSNVIPMAIQAWYNEYRDFNFKILEPSDFQSSIVIGHYTQMVWSNSVYLGCAISNYREGIWNTFLVVCNYGPAGNVIGEEPYPPGRPSNLLHCQRTLNMNCDEPYGYTCSRNTGSFV